MKCKTTFSVDGKIINEIEQEITSEGVNSVASRMGDVEIKYIVLEGRMVGSGETGFELVYNFDGEKFNYHDEAIKHGFKLAESDDFNIGRLENGKLVCIYWMNKSMKHSPEELAKIQEDNGI